MTRPDNQTSPLRSAELASAGRRVTSRTPAIELGTAGILTNTLQDIRRLRNIRKASWVAGLAGMALDLGSFCPSTGLVSTSVLGGTSGPLSPTVFFALCGSFLESLGSSQNWATLVAWSKVFRVAGLEK